MKIQCLEFVWRRAPGGRIKLMAYADNYVMVRYGGAMPFVLSLDEWLALPGDPAPSPRKSAGRANFSAKEAPYEV